MSAQPTTPVNRPTTPVNQPIVPVTDDANAAVDSPPPTPSRVSSADLARLGLSFNDDGDAMISLPVPILPGSVAETVRDKILGVVANVMETESALSALGASADEAYDDWKTADDDERAGLETKKSELVLRFALLASAKSAISKHDSTLHKQGATVFAFEEDVVAAEEDGASEADRVVVARAIDVGKAYADDYAARVVARRVMGHWEDLVKFVRAI